ASVYTERMDDPLAVYFTPDRFGIVTDGSQDVSDALQAAIDTVQKTVRYGVLFIPEGTYRISKTIHVWKGIRLIGYGKKRPVFVLGKNTDGYREGTGKYMFHFCSDKPWRDRPAQDANAGTFYSGIRNIDIRMEAGNPAAVAVRFHVAQHCFLSHMDFFLNEGNTGVEDIGNEIEYCRFFGGDYGIRTGKTSPGWQFILIDSYFEGQKKAAVKTQEAGLMMIRGHVKKVPSAVVNEGYPEELWISDSRFEEITGPAVIISNENNPRTQINFENIVCIKVPQFVAYQTTGEKIDIPHKQYMVKEFTHGLQYAGLGEKSVLKTTHDIVPLKTVPPMVASDVPLLPQVSSWVNLKALGAQGDGVSDDTEILEQAIANHQTIYLPSGHYRVTRPVVLKENTILVGLHPSVTQIMLKDSTAAYQGAGAPLPLLETPKGGTNIVTGIGLNTAGVNPRAVAAKWMAGAQSMMNDVRFVGGHGAHKLYGQGVPVYNDNRTADGIPYRTWDTQYWSLWVTDGGSGTFKDLWTPSPYAAAGMYISNTATGGRLYYMSSEHHVRNEVILNNVSNWRFFGLQLEEESGEGPYCLPIDIRNSSNLMFANTFLYRVSRITTPFPYAIRTENSSNLTFKGLHNYSWTKFAFENILYDATHNCNVRPAELALLKVSGNVPAKRNDFGRKVVAPGAELMKLAGGFDFIDGATVDAQGNVFFVDSKSHRIYRWGLDNKLSWVFDLPMNPISLAFDKSGHLMVITRFVQFPSSNVRGDIGVVSFDPNNPESTMVTLQEVNADRIPQGATIFYQATRHHFENFLDRAYTEKVKSYFISNDGSTLITNTNDIGQTSSLKPTEPGKPFYASTGPGLRTFKCEVDSNGKIVAATLFAETGAKDVAVDKAGNVYIPASNILVFDPQGNLIDEIEVPERPSTIVFGGKDKNTLYICGRSSLYSIQIK
ncbi:MAG: SMP-30/gluconolactonase/LRE family protein, partial [Bacteroidales bacterium]|nr:SMP-30/gluconolactonase/LRE family protein [Bacteroidales bacterium]